LVEMYLCVFEDVQVIDIQINEKKRYFRIFD